jgi:hypothetical protein
MFQKPSVLNKPLAENSISHWQWLVKRKSLSLGEHFSAIFGK